MKAETISEFLPAACQVILPLMARDGKIKPYEKLSLEQLCLESDFLAVFSEYLEQAAILKQIHGLLNDRNYIVQKKQMKDFFNTLVAEYKAA